MKVEPLKISSQVSIPLQEIQLNAIRAQGPGGQNVNKVSSAVHLRFDVAASSLPEVYKTRLLALSDSRISRDGVLVIKAQQHRSQEKNRALALDKLVEIIRSAMVVPKRRVPTKPGKAARSRRMDSKTKRGHTKNLRGKVHDE